MALVKYLWDPVSDNILREYDEAGNTIVDYTSEPDLYGNVVSQYRDGETSYLHFDGQGNTTELTDDAGEVTDTFRYSAFGEVTERTGDTVMPYQYVGRQGYYRDSETGEYSVRRRPLLAPIGRWLSMDPLRTRRRNGYDYADSNPLGAFDPSGLLTIKRARPRDPRMRRNVGRFDCGQFGRAPWDFLLDVPKDVEKSKWTLDDRPDVAQGEKGAPCEGFIVQHVTVKCAVTRCDGARCSVDREKAHEFDYYEAWNVKLHEVRPELRDRTNRYTDIAAFLACEGRCGYFSQKGEVRFYCKNAEDDPLKRHRPDGKGVGTGELADWDQATDPEHPLLFNKSGAPRECGTSPGGLRATNQKPSFWEFDPVDGPAFRQFEMEWKCCPGATRAERRMRQASAKAEP